MIDDEEILIDDIQELKLQINKLKGFQEILISGHGETTMLILLNPLFALLSFFRYEGDHGFLAIKSLEKSEVTEEFILSNGQKDEYPKNILIEREIGILAIPYYFKSGQMLPEIDWISQQKWTVL